MSYAVLGGGAAAGFGALGAAVAVKEEKPPDERAGADTTGAGFELVDDEKPPLDGRETGAGALYERDEEDEDEEDEKPPLERPPEDDEDEPLQAEPDKAIASDRKPTNRSFFITTLMI